MGRSSPSMSSPSALRPHRLISTPGTSHRPDAIAGSATVPAAIHPRIATISTDGSPSRELKKEDAQRYLSRQGVVQDAARSLKSASGAASPLRMGQVFQTREHTVLKQDPALPRQLSLAGVSGMSTVGSAPAAAGGSVTVPWASPSICAESPTLRTRQSLPGGMKTRVSPWQPRVSPPHRCVSPTSTSRQVSSAGGPRVARNMSWARSTSTEALRVSQSATALGSAAESMRRRISPSPMRSNTGSSFSLQPASANAVASPPTVAAGVVSDNTSRTWSQKPSSVQVITTEGLVPASKAPALETPSRGDYTEVPNGSDSTQAPSMPSSFTPVSGTVPGTDTRSVQVQDPPGRVQDPLQAKAARIGRELLYCALCMRPTPPKESNGPLFLQNARPDGSPLGADEWSASDDEATPGPSQEARMPPPRPRPDVPLLNLPDPGVGTVGGIADLPNAHGEDPGAVEDGPTFVAEEDTPVPPTLGSFAAPLGNIPRQRP